MGQRVYVLSQTEYSNILGIFTNIRQCRKYIESLTNKDQESIILHEIRLNEPEKGRIDMTKLLTLKESDRINQEKQKFEKENPDQVEPKKEKKPTVPKEKKPKVPKEKYNKNKKPKSSTLQPPKEYIL
jgi:hypothetical protein